MLHDPDPRVANRLSVADTLTRHEAPAVAKDEEAERLAILDSAGQNEPPGTLHYIIEARFGPRPQDWMYYGAFPGRSAVQALANAKDRGPGVDLRPRSLWSIESERRWESRDCRHCGCHGSVDSYGRCGQCGVNSNGAPIRKSA
jgi:hypothetical protein